ITKPDEPEQITKAHEAIAGLEAVAMKTLLPSAISDILGSFAGAPPAALIILTDGVPVHDPMTLEQAGKLAASKEVPLFFVGIGDNYQVRDFKLHDLEVEEPVIVGDNVVFHARLSGQGHKGQVDVVLKVIDKDGKEKKVEETRVRVDPSGKAVKFRLPHRTS